jgi:HAD superfamily hydrolase (TIGR01509 family)
MKERPEPGKVPWDLIAERVGMVLPPEVVLGPGHGEDAALVRIGSETWAIATDPITFASHEAGRLAVVVNANDVAVRGATPRLFLAVVLLALEDASSGRLEVILDQIRETCESLGVLLIGGHTEVSPGLGHSVVVGTMLGPVATRAITTRGARPGDLIGLTRWAGLEGTAILLTERGDSLRALHAEEPLRPLDKIIEGDWLQVVEAASVAAGVAEVSALHDVTEGGVGEALYELATAAGLRLDIVRDRIPVLPETSLVCADLGIDPLGLIGSGALLVACAPSGQEELEVAMAEAQIPFTWIGRASAGPVGVGGVPRFERDEILKVAALDGIEAVVFDMDGTLVDSSYDWAEIRARLGVRAPSIIDALNGLPSPEREEKWRVLHEIEREATRVAGPKEGAGDLLTLLREKGLPTALVTNNTEANAATLLERFGLELDVVITRDTGVWKPSGAPLLEALKRLGVAPVRSLAIGDSRHDLEAAGDAGCARVCILHDREGRYAGQADLDFPDIPALLRYLRIVL